MLDQVPMARPRVALVYGDAGAAGHLRTAVAGHVQIVYATAAAEFDAERLADSRATAALLNLDSCDWLDAVETRLHAAGVAVVYNDPDISRTLQGWEQARWLRHLTAKLSGSTDFDPPRPLPAEPRQSAETPLPAPPPGEAVAQPERGPEDAEPVAAISAGMLEQPLSPAEIASMTVNFNTVPEPPPMLADPPGAADPAAVAGGDGTVRAEVVPAAAAPDAEPATDAPLDVDTEALSALIDARLAEAEGHADTPPQVWRVAQGGAVSTVDLPAAEPAAAAPELPAAVAAPAEDDAEPMQDLPAIDDWQLVDRDAPVAPDAGTARREPVAAIDFAGLELVPIESVAPVEPHTESVDRWMHVGNGDAPKANQHKQPDANGGRA